MVKVLELYASSLNHSEIIMVVLFRLLLLFAVFGAHPKLAVVQETFTLPSAQTAGERGHLPSSSRNGNVFLSAKRGCTKCT